MIDTTGSRAQSGPFPDSDHDHRSCVAEALARAEGAFEANNLRLTELRRKVLEEVAGSHCALGAYEIIERLAARGQRLAPISVYRALDALKEVGAIHRLESRNAFFACHHRHGPGEAQILLVCEGCGRVAEVTDPAVFTGIASAARQGSFQPSRSLVEVIGTCSACHAGGRADAGGHAR